MGRRCPDRPSRRRRGTPGGGRTTPPTAPRRRNLSGSRSRSPAPRCPARAGRPNRRRPRWRSTGGRPRTPRREDEPHGARVEPAVGDRLALVWCRASRPRSMRSLNQPRQLWPTSTVPITSRNSRVGRPARAAAAPIARAVTTACRGWAARSTSSAVRLRSEKEASSSSPRQGQPPRRVPIPAPWAPRAAPRRARRCPRPGGGGTQPCREVSTTRRAREPRRGRSPAISQVSMPPWACSGSGLHHTAPRSVKYGLWL